MKLSELKNLIKKEVQKLNEREPLGRRPSPQNQFHSCCENCAVNIVGMSYDADYCSVCAPHCGGGIGTEPVVLTITTKRKM